jgi:hypothetical protein
LQSLSLFVEVVCMQHAVCCFVWSLRGLGNLGLSTKRAVPTLARGGSFHASGPTPSQSGLTVRTVPLMPVEQPASPSLSLEMLQMQQPLSPGLPPLPQVSDLRRAGSRGTLSAPVDIFHDAKGNPILCLTCGDEKKCRDPASDEASKNGWEFPPDVTSLWWNHHGRPDEPSRHSRCCGYCDVYRVKIHPGLSVDGFNTLLQQDPEDI